MKIANTLRTEYGVTYPMACEIAALMLTSRVRIKDVIKEVPASNLQATLDRLTHVLSTELSERATEALRAARIREIVRQLRDDGFTVEELVTHHRNK